MTHHEIGSELLRLLREMWTSERRRTLATIASFERQFETWWKFEIGVAWEQQRTRASKDWDDVWPWLEAHERCDVVIGRPGENWHLDDSGVVIPLELKTTGTWWRQTNKALAALGSDLFECASARRADPFAAVGILITHVEWDQPPTSMTRPPLNQFIERALDLGREAELGAPKIAQHLELGRVGSEHRQAVSGAGTATACQLVWTT
jgi:hypothetical protein